MPQALAVLPQIIRHLSNYGHLHWPASDSPSSYFNWLNFFCILCTLDWTWAQVRRGVNGNASSIFNKISCQCFCVKLFVLLARNFSSKKFINNAVESFFQSLLDLGGAAGAVWGTILNKGSEELEPIIIRDRKLGNLALETVPWWERQKKMWFKDFFWDTQCLYCVQWEKWLRNAGRWARVSTKVNGETRERLEQSAKRSAAVRGQAGRGATVAGRRLECYMAVKRHILRQKCAKN